MHRCWLIPELCARIAEACFPDYRAADITGTGTSSAEVARLARTCRAMLGAALDVLWYAQPGLHALLRCMPDDLWQTRVVLDERGGALSLSSPAYMRVPWVGKLRREVVPRDWARLDFYAGRVRRLRCPPTHSRARMEPSAAEYALLCRLKGGPLLPCLQSVVFAPSLQSSSDGPFGLFKTLLTESVTSLDIRCARAEDGRKLAGMMGALLSRAPCVQDLHVEMPPAALDVPVLLDALHSCPSLRDFRLTVRALRDLRPTYVLDTSLLSQFASFHKLVDLKLMHELAYSRRCDATSLTRFSSLEALLLDTIDIKCAIAMLGDLALPSVTTFSLSTSGSQHTPSSIITLMSALQTSLSTDTLRSLTLHINAAHADRQVSPSALAPLQTFHNLHSLVLRLGFPIALTDAALAALAPSWPHLRTLEIMDARAAESAPTAIRPTFEGLAHLVRRCPHLRAITLPLEDTDAPLAAYDLPVSAHAVRLAFGCAWTPREPQRTARWLARMFPRLADVNGVRCGDQYDVAEMVLGMREGCCDSEDVAWQQAWREVLQLVERGGDSERKDVFDGVP